MRFNPWELSLIKNGIREGKNYSAPNSNYSAPNFSEVRLKFQLLKPAKLNAASIKFFPLERITDCKIIGDSIGEFGNVVPAFLSRFVRCMERHAHVEAENEEVKVVTQT